MCPVCANDTGVLAGCKVVKRKTDVYHYKHIALNGNLKMILENMSQ